MNLEKPATDEPPAVERADLAGWVQGDVGWEYQTLGGTWMRMSGGFATLVHARGTGCTQGIGNCTPPELGHTIFASSFSIGPAFDL